MLKYYIKKTHPVLLMWLICIFFVAALWRITSMTVIAIAPNAHLSILDYNLQTLTPYHLIVCALVLIMPKIYANKLRLFHQYLKKIDLESKQTHDQAALINALLVVIHVVATHMFMLLLTTFAFLPVHVSLLGFILSAYIGLQVLFAQIPKANLM